MKHVLSQWYLAWLELRLWWLEFSIALAEDRQKALEVSLYEMDQERWALSHTIQSAKGFFS